MKRKQDKLEALKLLTDETDFGDAAGASTGSPAAPEGQGRCSGCACAGGGSGERARLFSDAELDALLRLHHGNVRAAAYDVLLRKAENSALRLSGGTELPDQREYWLARARSVRPNATRPVGRADNQ